MPKEGQKSVTLPEWVWDLAEKYFDKHKDKLKFKKITSTTGLITLWILESSQQEPDPS